MRLGNINNQLEYRHLRNVVKQINRGVSSYREGETARTIPLLNLRDVTDGRINPPSGVLTVGENEDLARAQIRTKDLILTTVGSTFRAAVAPTELEGCVMSSNLIGLRLDETIIPELLAAYLNSPAGQKQLQSRAAGMAQKSLNLKTLMELKIPVPSLAKQREIMEFLLLSDQHDRLAENEQLIRSRIKDCIINNVMGE